ncbi:MAG: 2-oxoacid:acceptor oxidoreductase subunit alpha [Desulfobulbaceae bacterium]|nr:2-oxoacid:acceptor oxidoreductase subunit alpha [Desulfobulbaceae bacterium]
MNRIERTNDFVIRFATVNGSGSASANNLFARSLFRMGLAVSAKNIFPSNIQGLPTWYEVRVNDQGYLARRGGVDMVVAVNGQTLRQDYASLEPGGYFFFDSSKQLPEDFTRGDITAIGIPLTLLVNEAFQGNRQAPLLKNIVYVGAVAALLDMDLSMLEEGIGRQYAKKPALAESNLKALQLGYSYAREHHAGVCLLRVRGGRRSDEAIMMDGNTAAALGALYAGATVVGWYPITPSTSVIEAFARYASRFREDSSGRMRVAVVQAEDELAAIGMVIGASWNGARSFTATSGPGISLMNEILGLAYFAEIPAVLINVQRVGPSTGMPTRTQQSDVISCAYASHGDTRHVLLFPATPAECFELTATAFDLAEELQTPVIVLSDLDLGMNEHVSLPLVWEEGRSYQRGRVLSAQDLAALEEQGEKWGRYLDRDGDGIPWRTLPGTDPDRGVYFTRGTSHNEYSGYTEDSGEYVKNMQRLILKWETAKLKVPQALVQEGASVNGPGVICYGTSCPAVEEGVALLEQNCGIKPTILRLRAFPFGPEVESFLQQHQPIVVVEQNRDAQMRQLLINECGIAPAALLPFTLYDGMPIASRDVFAGLRQLFGDCGLLELNSLPRQGESV